MQGLGFCFGSRLQGGVGLNVGYVGVQVQRVKSLASHSRADRIRVCAYIYIYTCEL